MKRAMISVTFIAARQMLSIALGLPIAPTFPEEPRQSLRVKLRNSSEPTRCCITPGRL
jgi:hypothetical protein